MQYHIVALLCQCWFSYHSSFSPYCAFSDLFRLQWEWLLTLDTSQVTPTHLLQQLFGFTETIFWKQQRSIPNTTDNAWQRCKNWLQWWNFLIEATQGMYGKVTHHKLSVHHVLGTNSIKSSSNISGHMVWVAGVVARSCIWAGWSSDRFSLKHS